MKAKFNWLLRIAQDAFKSRLAESDSKCGDTCSMMLKYLEFFNTCMAMCTFENLTNPICKAIKVKLVNAAEVIKHT